MEQHIFVSTEYWLHIFILRRLSRFLFRKNIFRKSERKYKIVDRWGDWKPGVLSSPMAIVYNVSVTTLCFWRLVDNIEDYCSLLMHRFQYQWRRSRAPIVLSFFKKSMWYPFRLWYKMFLPSYQHDINKHVRIFNSYSIQPISIVPSCQKRQDVRNHFWALVLSGLRFDEMQVIFDSINVVRLL